MNDTDRGYTRPEHTDTKTDAEHWLMNNGWKEDGIAVRTRIAADLLRLRRLADERQGTEDGRRVADDGGTGA